MNQEQKEQKIITDGTQAGNLLASDDFKVVKKFLKTGSDKIKDIIANGLSNELDENGNVIRSWQEKYWEYVGKSQALNSIEIYLKRKIDKKDAIIKNREASQGGEAKSK